MLQRDEHARTYNRVKSLWPRSESVDVHIPDWNQPIQFPIPFLETSGDNTWQLVHRVLSYLVNEPGELRLLSTLAETRMNAEDKPKAGSYTFVPIAGSHSHGVADRKDTAGIAPHKKGRAMADRVLLLVLLHLQLSA
ncbi:MAG: hypothetical protein CYPHOPRED_004265 [Cyphobasidiales sp. Tagirdzhanova-0007]|nr:MAG: hypothetical protein CYPHOPRED_004265 [Cyphobasidiales sp. Tagirdzhanova-0007]